MNSNLMHRNLQPSACPSITGPPRLDLAPGHLATAELQVSGNSNDRRSTLEPPATADQRHARLADKGGARLASQRVTG